jgi:hypothetical protein
MNAPEQPDMLITEGDESVSNRLIARVNAAAIRAAFPYIAVEDVRYYLCGVNIRPLDDGSVMVVATDGHRFIIVRDPNGYAETEIIASVSKDAIKHADPSVTFDVVDATGYKEGITGAVNLNYLADVFKIRLGAKAPSVRFFTRDDQSPLLFMMAGIGEIEVVGGVMKMTSEGWLPKWLPTAGEFHLQQSA